MEKSKTILIWKSSTYFSQYVKVADRSKFQSFNFQQTVFFRRYALFVLSGSLYNLVSLYLHDTILYNVTMLDSMLSRSKYVLLKVGYLNQVSLNIC